MPRFHRARVRALVSTLQWQALRCHLHPVSSRHRRGIQRCCVEGNSWSAPPARFRCPPLHLTPLPPLMATWVLQRITELKLQTEKRRLRRSLSAFAAADGGAQDHEHDAEEERALASIQQASAVPSSEPCETSRSSCIIAAAVPELIPAQAPATRVKPTAWSSGRGCAHGFVGKPALLYEKDGAAPPRHASNAGTHKAGLTSSALCFQEKASYKDGFDSLRKLKTEIEHRQQLAAQGRARLRADFARWLAVLRRQAGLPPPDEAELHATASPPAPAGMQGSTGPRPPFNMNAGDDRPGTTLRQNTTVLGKALQPESRDANAQGQMVPAVDAGEGGTRGAHPSGRGQELASAQLYANEQKQQQPHALTQPADEAQDDTAARVSDAWEVVSSKHLAVHDSGDSLLQPSDPQPDEDPFAGVDPEVFAAARHMLTGNLAADKDIIRFYEARTKLLRSQTLAPWRTL